MEVEQYDEDGILDRYGEGRGGEGAGGRGGEFLELQLGQQLHLTGKLCGV